MLKPMMFCCETTLNFLLSKISRQAADGAKASIWYYMTCCERALHYKTKADLPSLITRTPIYSYQKLESNDYMIAVCLFLLKKRRW
jgi:hypothetical protein